MVYLKNSELTNLGYILSYRNLKSQISVAYTKSKRYPPLSQHYFLALPQILYIYTLFSHKWISTRVFYFNSLGICYYLNGTWVYIKMSQRIPLHREYSLSSFGTLLQHHLLYRLFILLTTFTVNTTSFNIIHFSIFLLHTINPFWISP